MTSLLKSIFSPPLSRVIFLSVDKLCVYHFVKGKIGSSYLFDVTEKGRNYFERYLIESSNCTTYLLVDVVEEEYKQDTIPHVFGADKMALIERKKLRLFRDTPFFHAEFQGRESEGRKDDIFLFMGLTNTDFINPWLELLEKNRVPLASINSVPQITGELLGIIPDPSNRMLVVTQQSISGLRQSFYADNKLKISRLVRLPRFGTEPFGPVIREEVEKIVRYLNSIQLIQDDKPLDVYFLGNTELLAELKKTYSRSPSINSNFINLNDLSFKTGLNYEFTTPFCDQLLAHCLYKNKPENLYANESETHYFRMQNMSRVMYAVSMIIILAGMIFGGINILDSLTLKQQSIAAEKKAKFYNDRYQIARERLPKTSVLPRELETINEIVTTLNKYKSTPLELLKVISIGLDQYPDIQVNQIFWVSSANPNYSISEAVTKDKGETVKLGQVNLADQEHFDYYHIATISGYLDNFDGNYRAALAKIENFSESLRQENMIHDVSVTSLPLDISSDAQLRGDVDKQSQDANFAIRIVLGVRNET